EQVGADIDLVRKGMGTDPRVGPQFLFAGIGYGGSCFPKDVSALLRSATDHGYDFQILKSVESVNKAQKVLIADKIRKHFGTRLRGRTITLWGLAFKPNTDDIREAPALTIIQELLNEGVTLQLHDPVAMPEMRKLFPSGKTVKYFEGNYDALKGSDALVIVTEWNEFRRPDFDRMKSLMAQPVIFDGRNIYDPVKLTERGFVYYGIGRNGQSTLG
ncbi:MAG: UDP-glucose/GDP-mannose dehydrogenase family protein, partial [Ignavibacteriae bacterium]|nr:UDP-glucose/GDP-mannose dehydrogenase family protein [Ignavibacteriota bacterium]